ncbi:hypothetical protein ACWDSD_39095 [Streptomyces spiralis]
MQRGLTTDVPDGPRCHFGSEPPGDEQRDDAETTAAHHIYTAYPHALAQIVGVMAWRGEPSAVAWLDSGL